MKLTNRDAQTENDLRISIIAADPFSSNEEFLWEEAETVKTALRNHFSNPQLDVVRTADPAQLVARLNGFRPDIVHFTGHGSATGRVLLNDKRGWIRHVTGKSVARMLSGLTFRPRCLLFNSCLVSRQQSTLPEAADAVVIVRHRKAVDVSPVGAKAFYGALRLDLDFRVAYRNMRVTLRRLHVMPQLVVRYFPGRPLSDETKIAQEASWAASPQRGQFRVDAFFDLEAPEEQAEVFGLRARQELVDRGPRVYRVWFGTNRDPIDTNDTSKGFGSNRSSKVRYGYCDVTIPKYHTIGSIGDPWWKRLPLFWQDNQLHVRTLKALQPDSYWQQLQRRFHELDTQDRTLLVFLHGFNATFNDSVIRAAQLGFDLGVKGATALFSWPSKGSIAAYTADTAAIEASEAVLGDFLLEMANLSGAEHVHLVAHSMGNRGLLRAFSRIVTRIERALRIPFRQIFLAAPDVDVELFKQLAAVYQKASERTTMYVSGRDKALWSSGILHDYPRAGYTPPITVVPGIDTIEVTQVDLTFLGHGYVAGLRPVLHDMHSLMESNLPPSRRFGLEEIKELIGSYWRIKR